jgi:hypothetical protein
MDEGIGGAVASEEMRIIPADVSTLATPKANRLYPYRRVEQARR